MRKKVHQYVDNADEKVIKALFLMLTEMQEQPALKRFSLKEYNASLDKAEREVAKGKFLTHEQALKQMAKW
jgi:hypothetical protein